MPNEWPGAPSNHKLESIGRCDMEDAAIKLMATSEGRTTAAVKYYWEESGQQTNGDKSVGEAEFFKGYAFGLGEILHANCRCCGTQVAS